MSGYQLAYKDAFVRLLEGSLIVSDTSCSNPFPPLNVDNNELIYHVTGDMYTKMLSALKTGADLIFPNEANEIIWQFLKPLHCNVPNLDPNQDCYNYPPYAPFINYSPQSPFVGGGLSLIYPVAPFFRWGFRDTWLPTWLEDWFNSQLEFATGYQVNDVIVSYLSQPLIQNPFDGLDYPTIAINVNGTGMMRLHLLSVPAGGRALISVDDVPDLTDLVSAIFTSNDRLIELNRDFASIPPETDLDAIEEIEIDTTGSHTVYITFLPVLNDEGLFLQFGGGFRSVELCGFGQNGAIMGFTDLRIENCNIEVMEDGNWVNKGSLLPCIQTVTNPMQAIIDTNTANIASNDADIAALDSRVGVNESAITNLNTIASDHSNLIGNNQTQISDNDTDISNLQATAGQLQVQISNNDADIADHETRITTLENTGVGGGNGQSVKATAYTIPHFSLQQIDGSLGWTFGAGLSHDFIYPNALIIVEIKMHSSSSSTYARMRVNVGAQIGNHEGWARGTAYVSTQLNQVFENIPIGTQSIDLEFNNESDAETTIIEHEQQIQIAIIEYSNVESVTTSTVTFDAGGASYQLINDPNQVGTVQNAGNPDNALVGGCNVAEFVGIDYDNAGNTINDINLDMYLNDKNVFRLQIYIHGVLEYDQPMDFAGQSGVWFNHRVSDFNGSLFPMTANDVRIRIYNPSGNITTARMDNVQIEVQ